MTVSTPSLIGDTQPIIRIVEVLPAPLGPRNPNDSPGATSKSMASTATKSPKRLVRPRAWMSEGGTPRMNPESYPTVRGSGSVRLRGPGPPTWSVTISPDMPRQVTSCRPFPRMISAIRSA
jgi:hypothetical protein